MTNKNSKIVVFEVSDMDQTKEMMNYLKQEKVLVVNVQKVDTYVQQRIVDILFGACLGLNGTLRRISDNVYTCIPKCIELEDIEENDEA